MFKILIGLAVLSIMVFIHELGHFIAAKLCGVHVESFSIGWGPVIFRKKIGLTEYRISAIPMGGYCGMKGEKAFKEALEKNLSYIPKDEGGIFNVCPFRRILIAFAGPFANYISAVAAFAAVSAIGYVYYTAPNRIAPIYCYKADKQISDSVSPAEKADLRMGDRIIEINGKKIEYFSDIVKEVLPSADKELFIKIDRNGELLTKNITPYLDKSTGAGVIGFYPFVIPKIGRVEKGSAAESAGIRQGDIIIAIDGEKIRNTYDFEFFLQNDSAPLTEKTVRLNRDGREEVVKMSFAGSEKADRPGFHFEAVKVEVKGTGFFASVKNGFKETHNSFILTFKSLRLLFKGIDLKQAVSGPLRITHMIGEAAEQNFKEGLAAGFSGILSFIGIISIALFIMNLLPIPVLDGGLIVLSLTEAVCRRPLHPKIFYYTQFAGFAFIGIVFIFALAGDILFFIK